MEDEKKKIKTGSRGITDYFKRAIGYTYQQVVSKSTKVPTPKTEPEKVTNMVGTFLNDSSDGFQATTTKIEPEKVPS
ncbi:hypothetical protein [Emticicia sp. C21]|uniref:hypothetical protein n=1 Tax=Emticicia sp. C21 TaxID=2302915 RepID=UPI000E348138|nr:hypothetical protein [Emticicia sp. C21]RFS15138.1 hypothetical protein D0T08_18860 [Emticicia sp. C21]